jgi:hypothetical protein
VDVVAVRGQAGEGVVGGVDVAPDHLAGLALRGHREVDPDLTEERARRLREVVAVGREPLDGALARTQHLLVV